MNHPVEFASGAQALDAYAQTLSEVSEDQLVIWLQHHRSRAYANLIMGYQHAESLDRYMAEMVEAELKARETVK